MADHLFSYLPKQKIIEAFMRSPGNEFASGKFSSEESSAALAANTFGLFIDRAGDLPVIPGTEDFGWPATDVGLEECVPFPWWPRGRHPWLDALVETRSHVIGIESKRFEPYRGKPTGQFSRTFWRSVWGDGMVPFERIRDRLDKREVEFQRLDAVQLVKHAFGLFAEGRRRGKVAVLLYLYAEPETWANLTPVDRREMKVHSREVELFAQEVADAEVAFRICTYRQLLSVLRESPDSTIRHHANMIEAKFRP